MTDEQFEDMIKKIPKCMLDENGRLHRVKCVRCGAEWGCKVEVPDLICGVCLNFMERDKSS